MTRIILQTPATTPEESKTYLENAWRPSGFTPNLLLALSNSPQALRTYITASAINNNNSLSTVERETVQLIAATVHDYSFCVVGHSATVERKKIMPPADLQALRKRQPLPDPHPEAIVSFVHEVIAMRGAVSEAAWQGFRAVGYGERQALDVIPGISLATLCNFANSPARTPLNTEPSLRVWSD